MVGADVGGDVGLGVAVAPDPPLEDFGVGVGVFIGVGVGVFVAVGAVVGVGVLVGAGGGVEVGVGVGVASTIVKDHIELQSLQVAEESFALTFQNHFCSVRF